MKKLWTLLTVLVAFTGMLSAQCTVDSSNTKPGLSPDTLTCFTQGSFSNLTFQIFVPDSIDPGSGNVGLDSLVIDSITGFPAGLSYAVNPANGTVYHSGYGCVSVWGSTTASAGTYTLSIYGHIYTAVTPVPTLGNLVNYVQVCPPASTPCAIDLNNTNPGLTPNSLPCITADSAYGQVVQIYVPDSINMGGTSVGISSLTIDSIGGLPTGITGAVNPGTTINKMSHGCIWVSGTTTVTSGTFVMLVYGTLHTDNGPIATEAFLGDTVSICPIIVTGPCVIDQNTPADPGIAPRPNQLPCLLAGQSFDEVLQVKILGDTSFRVPIIGTVSATIDSMKLDSIGNLPAGLQWERTPEVLYKNAHGCLHIFGTTTAPVGRYNLQWWGTVWLRITSPVQKDTAYYGNLARFQFSYYLDVINNGDSCHYVPNGINDFSSDLNSSFFVYPNPSNGTFQFKMDAGKRIDGEIVVVDMTGRVVYNQKIDVVGLYNTSIDLSKYAKGLYTLQLRTSEGFASKNISIE